MKKKLLLSLLIPFALTSCNAFNSIPGPQGEQGDRGLTGEKGDQGPQGEQGDQGKTGPAGLSGPRGEQGDPGEKGPLGPQGDQGAQGDQGDKGPTGDVGSDATVEISENKTWIVNGVDTEKTVVGPQGSQGATGPDGSEGMKGDQGNAISPGPQIKFLHNQGGFVRSTIANAAVGEDVEFTITPYDGFYIYGYEVNGVQHIFEEGDNKTSFKTKMTSEGLVVRGLFKKPERFYSETIVTANDPIRDYQKERTQRNFYYASENDMFILSYDMEFEYFNYGFWFGIISREGLVNDTLTYEGPVLNNLYKIVINLYDEVYAINSLTIHVDDNNSVYIDENNYGNFGKTITLEPLEGTYFVNPQFSVTVNEAWFFVHDITFYFMDNDSNIY